MNNVLLHSDQATPAWLTGILRQQGFLPNGEVLAIQTQPNAAFNSHSTHLQANYSTDAPSGIPDRFLLKCNLQQPWAIPAGVREATFYQTIANWPDHPAMIAPCYDAAIDPGTGNSHILLQDLSATHVAPVIPNLYFDNLLAEEYLDQVIDTLVRLHAFWWQHSQLGSGITQLASWCKDETSIRHQQQQWQTAWHDLCEKDGEWFPAQLTTLFETVLTHQFALWERYTKPRFTTLSQLTLTHGDTYLSNFLCPRSGQAGITYLIDWQGPEVHRSAMDLVNLLATLWTPPYRAEREVRALKRYHQGLIAQGVAGYTWQDLVVDYRCALVDWLFQPLQDRLDGASKDYWYSKIQCLAAAFEDWHCAELFSVGN